PQAPCRAPPEPPFFATLGRPPSPQKQPYRLQLRTSRPNPCAESLSRRRARGGDRHRGIRAPATAPSLPCGEDAFLARVLPARRRPALLDCREDDLRSRVVPEADHENSSITHDCSVGPAERR